jgi:AAA ATPase domain
VQGRVDRSRPRRNQVSCGPDPTIWRAGVPGAPCHCCADPPFAGSSTHTARAAVLGMGQEASKYVDDDEDCIQEPETTNDSTKALKQKNDNGDGSSKQQQQQEQVHADDSIAKKIDKETDASKTAEKASSIIFVADRNFNGRELDATATAGDATPLRSTAGEAPSPRDEAPSPPPRSPPQSSSSSKRRSTAADYQELCIMKKARNQARLKQLGFGPASPSLAVSSSSNAGHEDAPLLPMLQDSSALAAAAAHQLKDSRSFPHRSSQIRQLHSLLSTRPIIPSPIFVAGPKGTGKSCIVRHVLQEAFQEVYDNSFSADSSLSLPSSSSSSLAFVDCAATSIIHPPKTAKYDTAILHAIYDQLSPIYRPSRAMTSPWKFHLELLDLDAETAGTATTTASTHATTTTATVGSSPPQHPRLVVLDHADGITLNTLQQLICLPNICWIILTRSSLLSMSGTHEDIRFLPPAVCRLRYFAI